MECKFWFYNLYLSYSLHLANLECPCFSVSLSPHSVLFTLPSESFLSFCHSFHFHVAMYNKQYLEKYSILCCRSSMAWLTIQTIFGESVIFTVNPLWHGWWHKAIGWAQCIAMMYIFSKKFIVLHFCREPHATLCHFLKNIMFTHYLLCIGQRTDFSLVWGLLRLAPITKSAELIKFKLY